MSEKLTVLIPCKDERRNIRPCIESVQQIAHEILVADSGSIDGTQDMVREMGCCRLIEHEWTGYARFKNWAIPQASHSWILIVDADERVTEDLAAEIRHVLADPADDIDAYRVPRLAFFLGYPIRHSGWAGRGPIRLIRRDRCRYREVRVHEEIDVAPERTGRLKNRLLHYSYWTYDEYLERASLYTMLGVQDRYDRGRRPSLLKMLFYPPVRFLKDYILRRGILDGAAGLQVCATTAFGVFLKEARLWEMHHARKQPDPEGNRVQDQRGYVKPVA